uniref:Multiple epidermal growth factor-like domains protein 6 n=1 Tax=Crassostrea virginica TaxID=6565 RepID=A0A8B8C4S1_CRAVI|nr:multiple epidermal growth factor-like domains protein 6 [Crassostrea virginica]
MTGLVFVFYCNWAVFLCLSVQAYENLALHKLTWQSSTYRDYTADLAVDGQYTGLCAVSDWGHTTVEWRVDLGGVKNIHHVLIHHDNDLVPWLFLGFSVYISNTTNKEDGMLCFRDTNYTNATMPNPVNITCPYHGRYVIYYNNRTHPPYPDGYKRFASIGLCQVEVYGCPSPGYYGKNCLKCPQNCHDGYCDSEEGTCLACTPGFIGQRCDLECSAGVFGKDCAENCSMTCGDPRVCDKVTGHCNGSCLPGWEGNMCQKECAVGSFGKNCSKNCSMTCGNPGVCHKVTGSCNGSCLAGWEGNMCENECLVGFYGVNCLQNCSMTCGIPGNCDRIKGYCHGGCQRGWRGVRCEEGKG